MAEMGGCVEGVLLEQGEERDRDVLLHHRADPLVGVHLEMQRGAPEDGEPEDAEDRGGDERTEDDLADGPAS